MQRLNRSLRLLSDCNLRLVRATDEAALLSDICRVMVTSGDYVMAWVGVPENDEQKSVRPVAVSGFENAYLDEVRISWDVGRGGTDRDLDNDGQWDSDRGGTDRDVDNDQQWDHERGGTDRDTDNDGMWDYERDLEDGSVDFEEE